MNTLKSNEQKENEIKNYKVYIHTNIINGKIYVGITKQRPERRWKNGWGYYDKTGRAYFWKAIQKYGWDNFKHEIIEENLSFEQAKERERYYISYYNSANSLYGYNLTLGGDGFLGQKRSQETKDKISKRVNLYFKNNHGYWYGKHIPIEAIEKQKETKRLNPYHHTDVWKEIHSKQLKGENNVRSRSVKCINTGEIFVNAREASEFYTSADQSRIHKCCKGKAKSSGIHPITREKLQWEYVDKENPRTEITVNILD
jgi:group I intron endonuclease